jgi:hypothetical protein
MITQVSAPAPTKDPLTTQDRQTIATIVNQSDYSKECQPEDVVTIWINSDDIVWVKMTHDYAAPVTSELPHVSLELAVA